MEISLFAVLVAAIAAFVIGMFWYSNAGFGRPWMRLVGMSKEAKKMRSADIASSMIAGFISWVVMAYVLAHFLGYAGAETFVDALRVAFWAWLGFVATVSLGGILWERRHPMLWVLNNAYNLLIMCVMALILTLWQ